MSHTFLAPFDSVLRSVGTNVLTSRSTFPFRRQVQPLGSHKWTTSWAFVDILIAAYVSLVSTFFSVTLLNALVFSVAHATAHYKMSL